MSPHPGVVLDSEADRLASVRASLCDVFEVVPSGQPVTRMCHDGNLFAAPGVNLRVSEGETLRESGAL